jgi:hypothetical protein
MQEVDYNDFLVNAEVRCWMHNNIEECTWVSFGYGSRWDMIDGFYRGFWLCEEAIKLFLYYDFHNTKETIKVYKSISFSSKKFQRKLSKFLEHSGGFMRDNKGYTFDYEYNETDKCLLPYPPLEEIKNINLEHYKYINRVYQINDILDKNSHLTNTPLGTMKKIDWNKCRASDEDMKHI